MLKNKSKNFFLLIIPVCTFLVLVTIAAYVSWQHQSAEKETLQLHTRITGEQTMLRLESWIQDRIQIVKQLSNDFSVDKEIDSVRFVERAVELRTWFPGFQALNWISSEFNITIVNPYEGNEAALGKNLFNHPNLNVIKSIKKANRSNSISRTEIIELFQGGKGFAIYCPVLDNNQKIKGFINGVFKIDRLVEKCLSDSILAQQFNIVCIEEENVFFSNNLNIDLDQSDFIEKYSLQVVDKEWEMRIAPKEELLSKINHSAVSWFSLIILFVFGAVSWLVYIIIQRHYALKNSEEKFRTIAEHSGDALYIIKSDSTIAQVNNQACLDLGYTRDEFLGMAVSKIDSVYDDKKLLQIKEKVDSGKIKRINTIHIHKDGTKIPVDVSLGIVTIEGENYYLCLARNMSETKRLHALESRAQRLETAGQVAGQVAHDFNNLLAPLMAYPDFIRDELDEEHPALEYLLDIENSAKQIAEINQQLLTLGRRGHYNQEIFKLNSLVSQVVRQIQNENNRISIQTNLDDEILNIKGGKSQISRIVMNLLYNAIDATQGKGNIKISTENYYLGQPSSGKFNIPCGEYVKLTVSDEGHGISSDVLPNIFLPFMTTKKLDKKRGSGLGLSVVEAVIKDHNGFIDVASVPGKGTTFYIYFPITREELSECDNEVVVGGSEKILVVDDDKGIRDVVFKILTQLGYDVTLAESGESALEILNEKQFDLLILDMIIQDGMDGTETYQKSLMINPNQNAVIVSGFAESNRVQEALDLGVSAFIKKPFESKTLASGIRNALDYSKNVSQEAV